MVAEVLLYDLDSMANLPVDWPGLGSILSKKWEQGQNGVNTRNDTHVTALDDAAVAEKKDRISRVQDDQALRNYMEVWIAHTVKARSHPPLFYPGHKVILQILHSWDHKRGECLAIKFYKFFNK